MDSHIKHGTKRLVSNKLQHTFGFIECFTTTFLHTHSWQNWVDEDWWGWGWLEKKSQKTLDTWKRLHQNKTRITESADKGLDSHLCHFCIQTSVFSSEKNHNGYFSSEKNHNGYMYFDLVSSDQRGHKRQGPHSIETVICIISQTSKMMFRQPLCRFIRLNWTNKLSIPVHRFKANYYWLGQFSGRKHNNGELEYWPVAGHRLLQYRPVAGQPTPSMTGSLNTGQ